MKPERGAGGSTIGRGDLVPHFDVTALDGRRVRYGELWQRRSLVFAALPERSESAVQYAAQLLRREPDFAAEEAALVISADPVERFPRRGVVVADRWGEVVYSREVEAGADLPAVEDLLDWVRFLRSQCPECPP